MNENNYEREIEEMIKMAEDLLSSCESEPDRYASPYDDDYDTDEEGEWDDDEDLEW